MWNIPSKQQLNSIPGLYSTENTPLSEKIVYLHFFIGGCDWYIIEYDGEDLFFGYAILNGDILNAEWGYISFNELKELKAGFVEVDCDLYWEPKPVKEVPLIRTW
jgi:hypothetical protein